MIEKTLIVLKPDAIERGICGDIITRFEKSGLKIVGIKILTPNRDFLYYHYETIGTVITRRGQKAFDCLLNLMMSGPVIAIVIEGIEAVNIVRKLVGSTEPKSANPGTIRGDYSHISFAHADSSKTGQIPNLIHASGNQEEAEKEINHWFKQEELVSYSRLLDKYIYA